MGTASWTKKLSHIQDFCTFRCFGLPGSSRSPFGNLHLEGRVQGVGNQALPRQYRKVSSKPLKAY